MMKKNYSIHDVVKFTIQSENIPKRMAIEYANFEKDHINNPDFIVEIGNFVPSKEDCYIVDHTYYIKEGYFYCKDSYKFGKWMIQVSGLESDQTHIKLSTNAVGTLVPDMFICAYVIDFFIRFKLESKGYSVVHASAMSKGGQAFLFPSQSGAGKTSTAIYLAESGYDYLGDDFVILHEGQVLSYPTALNIFAYNLNPAIRENLPAYDRVVLQLKDALYKLTARRIKIFTKMNPKDIPGLNITDASMLKAVYLLAQGDRLEITDAEPDVILNSLAINQKMESYPFFKYLLEYSYVFPSSNIARFWMTCAANLRKNLNGEVKLYSVSVPRHYSREVFEEFREALECGN